MIKINDAFWHGTYGKVSISGSCTQSLLQSLGPGWLFVTKLQPITLQQEHDGLHVTSGSGVY